MRLPFVTSGSMDVLIAALRSGGYLTDDASADAIRTAPAQLTEAARDLIAGGLHYGSGGGGGGGGAGQLSSADDIWVLLDTDNTNPTTPYTNWFTIAKGQTGVPVTDPNRLLMSLGSQSGPDAGLLLGAFGPRQSQVAVTDNMAVLLTFGAGGNGATTFPYGTLLASATGFMLASSTQQTSGLMLKGQSLISNYADTAVRFYNNAATSCRGGFYDLNTTSKFAVGADLVSSPGGSAFVVEKKSGESLLRLYSNDLTAERPVFLMGAYTHAAGDQRVQFCVGGIPGAAGQDPRSGYVNIGGGYGGASSGQPHIETMLVVSPDRGASTRSCAFQVWHRTDSVPADTHLVNFHSNLDLSSADEHIRLLSVTGFWGVNRYIAFEVRADATAYAQAFSTTGLDVAEAFSAPEPSTTYLPGTVMIVSDDTGDVISSSRYADPLVVGVVSTKPGMRLGGTDLTSDRSHVLHLAMAGTVPVRVTTAHGSIPKGGLLVSAEGGMAALAPDPAPAGSVIGKALESLVQDGDQALQGSIRMLVLNR